MKSCNAFNVSINTKEMRKDILKMAFVAKSAGAHLGGSLSLVEIMSALYSYINFDALSIENEDRDRVILSKGHGVLAQYVALKQLGIYSWEELSTFKSSEASVFAHPSMNLKKGIEFSSGSLGQGLSLGVGTALALKRKNNTAKVFVILGDGECDEGSVWEAVSSASHYKLDNLVAIVDKNKLQYDGETKLVLSMDSLADKWTAFGWNVTECDGHKVEELIRCLKTESQKPLVVIANTIKGKGISFMENNPAWHNGVVTQNLFEQAMMELEKCDD